MGTIKYFIVPTKTLFFKHLYLICIIFYNTFAFLLCHTFHLRSTLLSPTKPKKKKKPSITSVSLFGLTITD